MPNSDCRRKLTVRTASPGLRRLNSVRQRLPSKLVPAAIGLGRPTPVHHHLNCHTILTVVAPVVSTQSIGERSADFHNHDDRAARTVPLLDSRKFGLTEILCHFSRRTSESEPFHHVGRHFDARTASQQADSDHQSQARAVDEHRAFQPLETPADDARPLTWL